MKLLLKALMVLLVSAFSVSPVVRADTIIFDQAHDQKFLITGDEALALSRFAQLFQQKKHNVMVNQAPLDEDVLAKADVLIISGAFREFTEPEIAAIKKFVINGGNLSIMLHVAPLNVNLLKHFGIFSSNGVIKETTHLNGENATDFVSDQLTPHPLTTGIGPLNFYGAWALQAHNHKVTPLVSTSETAWIDMNNNNAKDEGEPTGPLTLVLAGKLGNGKFVVFGDDAIFQNRFLTGDNLGLANNLVSWLAKTKLIGI